MADFQRDSLSLTSPLMMGGAKKNSKKHSKKGSKKGSKKMVGGKKNSKKDSKKGSKKGSRKQSRGMPQFMVDMMAVKKDVKAHHTDIKDGPALSKVVSEHLKSSGSVKGAIDELVNMSGSQLKSKLDKVNKEIAEKRAAKKSA